MKLMRPRWIVFFKLQAMKKGKRWSIIKKVSKLNCEKFLISFSPSLHLICWLFKYFNVSDPSERKLSIKLCQDNSFFSWPYCMQLLFLNGINHAEKTYFIFFILFMNAHHIAILYLHDTGSFLQHSTFLALFRMINYLTRHHNVNLM